MNRDKKRLLPDVFKGHKGVHLTAYLPEVNGKESMFNQLDSMIDKAERLLLNDYDQEFTDSFLRPVRRLRNDHGLIEKKGNGCWALFRTQNSFRLKKMPVKLPSLTVVSDSFHIKPVLKWAQSDKDCYLLSITNSEARLYEANLKKIELIGVLPLGPSFFKETGDDKLQDMQFKYASIDWLDDWMSELISDDSKPLVLAGRSETVSCFWFKSRYPVVVKEYLRGPFSTSDERYLHSALVKLLHEISGRKIAKSLKQFNRARIAGDVSFSLSEIAEEAVKGTVKRLYIAEDHYIWGVLCRNTGGLSIHSSQQNALDDDLLDDLAEIVLDQGFEVILLPSHRMPDFSSIAAIVKRQPANKPESQKLFFSSREIA